MYVPMNKKQVNEAKLRLRCLKGDREAAGEFVRQYSDLVYRTVQYTLRNRNVSFTPEDISDLHNTVFLNLFENNCKKLAQFKGRNGCSLATWVRLVAMRIVLNHLRKRGVDSISGRRRMVGIDYIQELNDEKTGALAMLEKADQLKLLKRGIRNLPAKYRLFFRLHFDHDLSVKEIAQIMRISVDYVYTVKHRAIKRLKAYVAKEQAVGV
jgi:RNA polymerase sigma factor (sigma-70 family)